MTPPVSAREMRDRILSRLAQPSTAADSWVQVLGAPGSRELLGLIGRARPQSVGALSDLAGRAQPNVSRSLNALVAAGLVRLSVEGRRTIPSLTELGFEKASELNLIDHQEPPRITEPGGDALFAVNFVHGPEAQTRSVQSVDSDAIVGTWSVGLWLRGASERAYASQSGDLTALATQSLAQWWRMLYRRDAPMKMGEFALAGRTDRSLSLIVSATGQRIDLITRAHDGEPIELAPHAAHQPLDRFEAQLLDEFIRPIAVRQRAIGLVDRPLQSWLNRLDESRANVEELSFCRTAGALGISPYNLDDSMASRIRELVSSIADEDARLDFASAVLQEELEAGRLWTTAELTRHGQSNRLAGLDALRTETLRHENFAPKRPWQRGRDFARAARLELGIGTDRSLEGIGGLVSLLGGDRKFALSDDAPGSIRGFQSTQDGMPIVVAEDEGPAATSFVLARAVGDYLVFGSREACVADLYTDRQAVGRAFAAEFLAPGEGVTMMLDQGTPIYRVAKHFGVSSETVRRQYENYGQW